MPLKDSAYTSPDSLRILYRNPRNPLRETSDQNENQVFIEPSPPPFIPPPFCPALGEYILSCVGIPLKPMPQPMPVSVLRKGMPLWNAVSQTFARVADCKVVRNVECVQVQTTTGITAITSAGSLGIVDLADEDGRCIYDLLVGPKETPAGAVYWTMGTKPAQEGEIEKIYSAGKLSVMKITLEEIEGVTPMYCSGSKPTSLLCWHNKPPVIDPNEPPE